MTTSDCEPEQVSDCDADAGGHGLREESGQPALQPAAPLPGGGAVWTIRLLCLAAVGVSGYLAWTAVTMGEVYGCGSGAIFDCGHVLTSKWSKLFGIPVSIPAVALWGSLLAAMVFARTEVARQYRDVFWSIIAMGAFSAGLAALWFIGIQVFVIQHLCIYCLAAHTCGLVVAGMMLWMRPMGWSRTLTMGVPAAAGFLILSLGQYLSPEPKTFMVERFDTEESEVALADEDAVFAPPEDGAEETAPELFAPPGELFEPPQGTTSAEEQSTTQNERPDGAHESGSAADPAVAARLLTIHPGWWLTRMVTARPHVPGQEAQEETDQDAADSEEGEPEQQAAEAKPQPRLVSVQGKKFVLNSRQWPLVGDPDARYIFVEMLDYTCPHCRATHQAVKGACQKFGDELAVIVLPVPLDRRCNPYASGGGHAGACDLGTLAVAVWRAAPEQFSTYHCWLMEGGRSRSPSEAKRRAEQLIGAQALKAEMDSKVASEYIKRHVELYRRVGQGAVPKIMFPNATMTGEVRSTTTLCNRIERELATR